MNYVVDLRHFLAEDGSLLPGRPGKYARYYASLVEAATQHTTAEAFVSDVPCRCRPGRKPCSGRLLVCRLEEGRIAWQCSGCNYTGTLSGWEGSPWDRSRLRASDSPEETVSPVPGSHGDSGKAAK